MALTYPTMMIWFVMSALLAAAGALTLAVVLLVRNSGGAFHRAVAWALAATALVQVGNGMGLLDLAHAFSWRRFSLIFELLFVVALQYVGVRFMRTGNAGEEAAARWRARGVALLALTFASIAPSDLLLISVTNPDGQTSLALAPLGRVAYIFVVLALTLGLAQLEQILRATRDPLRYVIKYVLIGLGALAGYAIYEASRLLMLPVWNDEFVLAGAVATVISVSLMAFGFARLRFRDVRAKVYVSRQVVYGSVTFLVIGIYLLAAGLVGEVISHVAKPMSLGLSVSLVFVASLALVVVLFSRAARATVVHFISRHFYRAKYDYRAKWLEVTEAFGPSGSAQEILDRLIELLGKTFGAVRLTIWMRYDADERFHQVRSVNTEPAPGPLDATHPVILKLMERDEPVELDEETSSDDPLNATDAILCVPIRPENRLIGFITLSRQFQRAGYGQDDFDLLRAIAHHSGILFALARLAEEKSAAGELEALYRFSAFCLHDLKNLAAKLSLVVQNAEVHGHDPAFHQAAMRTVAGTVEKMMGLITRLSMKSPRSGAPEAVDVAEVIAETVGALSGDVRGAVEVTGERVGPVRIVRDQLQQVLLNLVLNAHQELARSSADVTPHTRAREAPIIIHTEQQDKVVVLTVMDRGQGISGEGLQQVFQPFKSTKSYGLGLGLYQCKRIVEEHGGKIRIISEPGRGTTVRIELPRAEMSDNPKGQVDRREKVNSLL